MTPQRRQKALRRSRGSRGQRRAKTAQASTATPASATLSQAILYAAVGWLALCVERTAAAVDIQPVGEGLYEVSVHFDEERAEGIILRVRLEVAPGLVLRTVVEPVRPS